MNRLVLDASVCLKWFLIDEEDAGLVLALHALLREGSITLIEPAIWHCEIAAVLARKYPRGAVDMIAGLGRFETVVDATPHCLSRATELAIDLDHHLFDTIYHAIAIEHGIDLVTADEHYYSKARRLGNIVLLCDWRPPQGVAEEPAAYRARVRKTPARGRKKRR